MSFFGNSNKPGNMFSTQQNSDVFASKPSNNPLNPPSNNPLNPPSNNPLNPNPPSNAFGSTFSPLNPASNPPNPSSNPLNPPTSNPLFGGKPVSNIFGNPGSLGAGSGMTTNPLTSSSSTAPASGSLFGNKPGSAAPSGGIFGGGSSTGDAMKPTGSLSGAGSTTAPSTNSLFGNAASTPSGSSLFGGQISTTPKPAEGNAGNTLNSGIFGSTTTSTAPATSGTSTGSLFGLPSKPTETSTTTTSLSTPQPAAGTSSSTGGTGIFGGGGLFGKPATTTTPTTAGSGTTTLPTGSLFGSKPAEKKDAPAAAPASLGLFGAKKDNSTAKPEDKSIAAPGMNLPTVAVPPPSALRGKTLEEIVNRWASDLENHAREFNRYAAEVAVWDRALIENGNTLAALYSHITAAERQQDNIDQSLSHIEQQQKDLTATLDAYERMSQELLGGQSGSLRTLDTGPADTERDKNYMLATDLHAQLDDLSGSLTQMIDAVNGLSVSSKPNGESNDDPMSQISQVLSSHLESLQWIDGAVREVEGKVSDIEKRVTDSGYNLTGGGPNQGKSRGFGLHR